MSATPCRPSLGLIAAVARNGAIGKGNALIWSEPADQQHFRRVTMGSPVIMGRKTWDSLPARFRPLPGRRNIVLTRDAGWKAEGAEAVSSLNDALALLNDEEPRVWVIGGAEIYALALPQADELVMTEIDADLDGSAFFPAFDRSAFKVVGREAHASAAGIGYSFVNYKRIKEI
jgi:dihydrofolate reductase